MVFVLECPSQSWGLNPTQSVMQELNISVQSDWAGANLQGRKDNTSRDRLHVVYIWEFHARAKSLEAKRQLFYFQYIAGLLQWDR